MASLMDILLEYDEALADHERHKSSPALNVQSGVRAYEATKRLGEYLAESAARAFRAAPVAVAPRILGGGASPTRRNE